MMASTKLYPELTAAAEFAKQATHDMKAVEKQLQQIPLTADVKTTMQAVLTTTANKLTQLSVQTAQHTQRVQQQLILFKNSSQHVHHQLEQMSDAKTLLADKVKQAKQQLSDNEKSLKSAKTTLKQYENNKLQVKSELKDTIAALKQSKALYNELQQLLQKKAHYEAIENAENEQEKLSARKVKTAMTQRNKAEQRAHNHQLMKDHGMIRTVDQQEHVDNVIAQETKRANRLNALLVQQEKNERKHSRNSEAAKRQVQAIDGQILAFMQQHHLGEKSQVAFQAVTEQVERLQKKSDNLGGKIAKCDKRIKEQSFVVKQYEHDTKSARQQLDTRQKTYKTIADKTEQIKKQDKMLHQQIVEVNHLQKALAFIDRKIENIKDRISDKITRLVYHVKKALHSHSRMLEVANASLTTNQAVEPTEVNTMKAKR